jgi:hypothetical protein
MQSNSWYEKNTNKKRKDEEDKEPADDKRRKDRQRNKRDLYEEVENVYRDRKYYGR